MAFQFRNQRIYNVKKGDDAPASKEFIEVYNVAKDIVAERNEQIIELVFGVYQGGFFAKKGLLVATDKNVLFIGDKKLKHIVVSWSLADLKDFKLEKEASTEKITFLASNDKVTLKSITEGNTFTFSSYIKRHSNADVERYKTTCSKPSKKMPSSSGGQTITIGRSLDIKTAKDAKAYGIKGAHWSAILDDKTCPLCRFLDGKVISVDHPDFNRFIPPLHDGCRCIRIYIGKEDSRNTFDWETPDEKLVKQYLWPKN